MIESASSAVEKIGRTPNTLFVGIMLWVLVFLVVWWYMNNISQTEARDAYLSAMEKRDDKFWVITDKLTDALKENTTVMIELKSKIK